MAEHSTVNRRVVGSFPAPGAAQTPLTKRAFVIRSTNRSTNSANSLAARRSSSPPGRRRAVRVLPGPAKPPRSGPSVSAVPPTLEAQIPGGRSALPTASCEVAAADDSGGGNFQAGESGGSGPPARAAPVSLVARTSCSPAAASLPQNGCGGPHWPPQSLRTSGPCVLRVRHGPEGFPPLRTRVPCWQRCVCGARMPTTPLV